MTVLAEKLAARKDLVAKIGRLDDEIAAALVVDEGDTPNDTATAVSDALKMYHAGVAELVSSLALLQAVENEIRAANIATAIDFEGGSMSISEAIVLRDRLKTEFSARTKIADAADEATGRKRSRYDYGERRKKDDIRTLTVIAPKNLREEADKVARRMRLLDVEIQKANWATEV